MSYHDNPAPPPTRRVQLTASDIVQGEGLVDKLPGKHVLITGVSSGIGVETARALLLTGATVYGTARNLERAKRNLRALMNHSRFHLVYMDNADLSTVRVAAAHVLRKSGGRLNILIANATTYQPKFRRTRDGFEYTLGVNYIAHFALFEYVRAAMSASSVPGSAARLVNVTCATYNGPSGVSFAATQNRDSYSGLAAYAQSKQALLWMVRSVQRRHSLGIDALAADPGLADTDLARVMLPAMAALLPHGRASMRAMRSVEQAAAMPVMCAVCSYFEGDAGACVADYGWAKPRAERADVPSGKGTNDVSEIRMLQPGYVGDMYDSVSERLLWKSTFEALERVARRERA